MSSLFSIMFGLVFYNRLKMDYNEDGRYFDGLVVYKEQAVYIYGFLFFLSFIAATLLFSLARRYKNNK